MGLSEHIFTTFFSLIARPAPGPPGAPRHHCESPGSSGNTGRAPRASNQCCGIISSHTEVPEHRGNRFRNFHFFDLKSSFAHDSEVGRGPGWGRAADCMQSFIIILHRAPPYDSTGCRSTGWTRGGLAHCCLMTLATRSGVWGRRGGPGARPATSEKTHRKNVHGAWFEPPPQGSQ